METVRNPEGIGSIGRLLARSRRDTTGPYAINGNSFYHADGNGNVMYLASSSGGTDAAYRYDPFGRWLAQTGPYASANVMRFSSKPWVAHNGSNTDGLYYYGYRFYDPLTQRWLNRDPIAEDGGKNLYVFANNSPLNAVDPFGLRRWCGTCDIGGGGWILGFQGIICDLTSPCTHGKGWEYVHVRAIFFTVSAGIPDLPGVTAITFRTCFETPDGFDAESSFSGSAHFVSGSIAVGKGGSAGKIVLGYAVSEGLTKVTGFDLGVGFGSGRSWVDGHSECDCR
jgi:RHS repeat-associated protein